MMRNRLQALLDEFSAYLVKFLCNKSGDDQEGFLMTERNYAPWVNNLSKLSSIGFAVSIIGMVISAFYLEREFATIFHIFMWFCLSVTVISGYIYRRIRDEGVP